MRRARHLLAPLAALTMVALPGLAAAQWVRTGLEFHAPAPPPEPVVDRARVAEQQAQRCETGPIRFGDTAAMRGLRDGTWEDQTRRLAAIAALADRAETAREALAEADPAGDDPALTDLRLLTALQLGDSPDVPTGGLQGPALSDRLFWRTMVAAPGATPNLWATTLLPALDAALAADPTSFQVRAWRVIGWLRADGAARGTCAARIADWSTRLLDLSEASACPLMLGHVAHATDLAMGSRPDTDTDATRATWRRFGEALLAVVAGRPEVAAHQRAAIARAGTPCAGPLVAELDALARIGGRP
ncbi:hypothetical protein [Marinibacterium sp. SX1]|uniref:hypothetical protein n=1 Tax=Marinibacterium sp. SX1 TaxID=3388424 RepID=UPI003D16DBF1